MTSDLVSSHNEDPARNPITRPPETKGTTSRFDRRNDVGLLVAGGAQKLPGPHQTSRNNIKEQIKNLYESNFNKKLR